MPRLWRDWHGKCFITGVNVAAHIEASTANAGPALLGQAGSQVVPGDAIAAFSDSLLAAVANQLGQVQVPGKQNPLADSSKGEDSASTPSSQDDAQTTGQNSSDLLTSTPPADGLSSARTVKLSELTENAHNELRTPASQPLQIASLPTSPADLLKAIKATAVSTTQTTPKTPATSTATATDATSRKKNAKSDDSAPSGKIGDDTSITTPVAQIVPSTQVLQMYSFAQSLMTQPEIVRQPAAATSSTAQMTPVSDIATTVSSTPVAMQNTASAVSAFQPPIAVANTSSAASLPVVPVSASEIPPPGQTEAPIAVADTADLFQVPATLNQTPTVATSTPQTFSNEGPVSTAAVAANIVPPTVDTPECQAVPTSITLPTAPAVNTVTDTDSSTLSTTQAAPTTSTSDNTVVPVATSSLQTHMAPHPVGGPVRMPAPVHQPSSPVQKIPVHTLSGRTNPTSTNLPSDTMQPLAPVSAVSAIDAQAPTITVATPASPMPTSYLATASQPSLAQANTPSTVIASDTVATPVTAEQTIPASKHTTEATAQASAAPIASVVPIATAAETPAPAQAATQPQPTAQIKPATVASDANQPIGPSTDQPQLAAQVSNLAANITLPLVDLKAVPVSAANSKIGSVESAAAPRTSQPVTTNSKAAKASNKDATDSQTPVGAATQNSAQTDNGSQSSTSDHANHNDSSAGEVVVSTQPAATSHTAAPAVHEQNISIPVSTHTNITAVSAARPTASRDQQDAAVASTSAPDTQSSVSSARIIQNLGQTEMKVGLHSTEFGNISISTSSTRDSLTAQISLDHADLARTLSSHLPEMSARLGNSPSIDVRLNNGQSSNSSQSNSQQGSMGGNADSSRGSRQQSGNQSSYGNTFGTGNGMFIPSAANTSSESILNGRLDLQA